MVNIGAVSSHFIISQYKKQECELQALLVFLSSFSLKLICQALYSSGPAPQVSFYIHHKSDAAVAIFTFSPIIIVYRQ